MHNPDIVSAILSGVAMQMATLVYQIKRDRKKDRDDGSA